MKNCINQDSFKGQNFYIGIDVHKKNWKVTIQHNKMALKTCSMNPIPKELFNHMKKNYPGGNYYSVYEAGFCGYWIHRKLSDLGFKNIVINPADVPTSQKEKTYKTDKRDSRKLARELENGSLTGIYIPTMEETALRSISRIYQQLIKRRTQIKNRIKSFLFFNGIEFPDMDKTRRWSMRFIQWLKDLPLEQEWDRYYLNRQLNDLEVQRKVTLDILTQMRGMYKQNTVIQKLKSVTGIGLVNAFTLYAELFDIERFDNLDNLASYVVLIPAVNSSGDNETIKGLTFRHGRYIRHILIEAAWVGIRKDPALTLKYNELTKRMSGQKAIIRIAKKILSRIRYVWLNEKDYVYGVVA